ncbi:MAG: RNA-directed DNA polymerase [Spirochaetaceae bacterium]|nr:RNA-directed DNA polymerase [Spirochaetaceae bacterium]
MSKKLAFVDLSDKYRPLLTDVLPYETTLVFSNEGFHSLVKELSSDTQVFERVNSIINNFKKENNFFFIPYSFSVIRKDTKKRKLSLPHPLSQLDLCDLYEDYSDYIIYLCTKSDFSLRYPSAISSKFYKKGCLREDDDDIITASNYFKYSNYRLLYKFYDSRQFVKLEKKYAFLRKLDISNCFSSIYTHTISWAVKTKDVAKHEIGLSNFEQNFDKFMQHVNYNETAGIVIGPEFSRIFAEIIFQYIDLQIKKRLVSEDYKLKLYKDYEIYRYVDDMFVFSNKIDNLELIEKVIREELEPFRLYLNDNKEKDFLAPFASDVSAAKDELQFLFNELSDCIKICDNKISFESLKNSYTSFINRLKNILYRNNTSVFSVDSYVFHRLKNMVKRLSNQDLSLNEESKKVALSWIENILEISFYVFSLDIRITPCNKISYILVNINNFMKANFDENDINNVNKLIFDEILHIIKKEINKDKNEFIEIANLLLVLKSINFIEKIPEKDIDEIVSNILTSERFDYFTCTTLLSFTSNNAIYNKQRNKILDYIKCMDLNLKKADHFLLIFDFLTYPEVTRDEKLHFIRELNNHYGLNLTSNEQEKVVDYLKDKTIFTDWSQNIDFNRKLQKKEFIAPYE